MSIIYTPFSYCLESILENMTIFILMQFLKPPLPVNSVNFSHVYSFSQTRSVLIETSFHSLNDLRNSESVSWNPHWRGLRVSHLLEEHQQSSFPFHAS